jgi:hypothetical protein
MSYRCHALLKDGKAVGRAMQRNNRTYVLYIDGYYWKPALSTTGGNPALIVPLLRDAVQLCDDVLSGKFKIGSKYEKPDTPKHEQRLPRWR